MNNQTVLEIMNNEYTGGFMGGLTYGQILGLVIIAVGFICLILYLMTKYRAGGLFGVPIELDY